MATIRKRGSRWHVQIRHVGQPSITRSFAEKQSAIEWARQTEAHIDRSGLAPNRAALSKLTLGDLLVRYQNEIVVHKRGSQAETYIVEALAREKMSVYSIGRITPDVLRRYRDERLKLVKGATVCRQLSVLQHAFNVAIKEWGYPLSENPVAAIAKPPVGPSRNRRLQEGEFELLLNGCANSRVWWLKPLIILAIETGMRRGELLSISQANLSLEARTLYIPVTKNGHPRTIPLTEKACDILNTSISDNDRIFPPSANAFRLAWERLKRRVGIEDLRFHDLRHEAISRFFEMGLSVPEVALISGHRDYRMLFRYTHLRAEDVVKKLR